MTSSTVHLAFAADDNYAQHLTVAIYSLLKAASSKNFYNINILDGGISPKNKHQLETSLERFSYKEINYTRVELETFSKVKKFLHLNESAYLRLILPDIFKKIDKILYFDCDLLFFKDVADLYQEKLEGSLAGAVQIFHPNYQATLEKIFGLNKLSFCFNSGVMVLDLKKMRQERVTEKLLEFMNNNANSLVTADQDILNIVLANLVKPLAAQWNVGSYIFYAKSHDYCGLDEKTFKDIQIDPGIIHFDGSKPWNFANHHPYQKQYFAILDQTEFKNWRPSFDWQLLISNYSFYFATKISNLLPDSVYKILEKFYLKNNFLSKKRQQIAATGNYSYKRTN